MINPLSSGQRPPPRSKPHHPRRVGSLLLALWAISACSATEPPPPDASPDSRVRSEAGPEASTADLRIDLPPADLTADAMLPAAPPQISPAEGSYAYGTPITLSAAPGARIYFTLNGGDPTSASTLYTAPLRLTRRASPLTVRAMAMEDDRKESAVSTVRYTLQSGIIIHFKKPAGWAKANIHYWGTVPGDLSTTWPGVPMTDEGDGWFFISLKDQTAVQMVFNGGDQPQTEDLLFSGPEGWYQDGDWWDINPDHFQRFAFPGGKYKALTMSYDDGNLQDKQLIALFNTHGIRGTFNLNSGLMNLSDKVPAGEVKATYTGHEVAAHSVTHPYLDQLSPEQLQQEIQEDKIALGGLVGYDVRGLAYPFGSYSELLLSLLPGWGLIYGRVVPSTNDFRLPSDLLRWRGSCHHTEAMSLAAQLLARTQPKLALLYIWGHSWELDGGAANNSWSYMADLCATLGNQADIWYATNIEVADYLNALRAAQFSLTDDSVTNGAAQPIWVKKNGQAVELAPQATLEL